MENDFAKEGAPNTPTFIVPALERERGEVERVAEEVFGKKDTEQFVMRFFEIARSAPLVDLSEDMWSRLENTDSYGISPRDWSYVNECAVMGHPDHPRDWRGYKTRYEKGNFIEAPTVMKTKNMLHLVSGNTRLMVARALGITPKVLLVELEEET